MENKNLTFGEATKLLKEGKAVRRKGLDKNSTKF